jgi:hypothetical protein
LPISFHDYARSYRNAARELVESSTIGTLRAFPAVFLYRHAIEVYIKAILINFGDGVVTKAAVIDRGHGLEAQLPDLKKVCAAAGLSVSSQMTSVVNDWTKQDPDGVSLRYPESKVKRQGASEHPKPKEKGPGFQRAIFLNGAHFDMTSFVDNVESVLDELDELFSDLSAARYCDFLRSEGILLEGDDERG